MNTEFASLFKLARAERLQLVEDVWDSIAQKEDQLPVSDWKREELRRRKERFQAHPVALGNKWSSMPGFEFVGATAVPKVMHLQFVMRRGEKMELTTKDSTKITFEQ